MHSYFMNRAHSCVIQDVEEEKEEEIRKKLSG
jgi:hypothetical protein